MGNAERFELLQFVGNGFEGDTVLQLIDAKKSLIGSIEYTRKFTVRPTTPCRTCITLVSPLSTTEIVEPSGSVSQQDVNQLLSTLELAGKVGGLAVMGSMPPGCPPKLYADIINQACDSGSQVT
jgi:fructose-1-phosphate kinase PfkB-like protein